MILAKLLKNSSWRGGSLNQPISCYRNFKMSTLLPNKDPSCIYDPHDQFGSEKTSLNHSPSSKPGLSEFGYSDVCCYFDKFDSYIKMISDAKSIAKKSVLVDGFDSKYIDLSRGFDNLSCIHHIQSEGSSKWMSLFEFKFEGDARRLTEDTPHRSNSLNVPMKILHYYGPSCRPYEEQKPDCPVFYHVSPKANEIYDDQSNTKIENYSDLMSKNVMSIIDLKLRFVTLVNLEDVLCSGVFKEYEILPFGSSASYSGTRTGDLDLVVTRKRDHRDFMKRVLYHTRSTMDYSEKRSPHSSGLVHLDMSLKSTSKTANLDLLRWFSLQLREFVPISQESNVIFIQRARVPILKFTTSVTQLDCDLSFDFGFELDEDRNPFNSQYSGILITQLLYNLYQNNDIFKYLTMYLRMFARYTGIHARDQRGFTSFQLLSLIIFYLQRTQILPKRRGGISNLIVHTNSDLTSELDFPVLKPLQSMYFKLASDMPIGCIKFDDETFKQIFPKVVKGFFDLYSEFEFDSSTINLNTGKRERKRDNSPVYVSFPLDSSVNICKSVGIQARRNFTRQVLKASKVLGSKYQISPLDFINNLMTETEDHSYNDN